MKLRYYVLMTGIMTGMFATANAYTRADILMCAADLTSAVSGMTASGRADAQTLLNIDRYENLAVSSVDLVRKYKLSDNAFNARLVFNKNRFATENPDTVIQSQLTISDTCLQIINDDRNNRVKFEEEIAKPIEVVSMSSTTNTVTNFEKLGPGWSTSVNALTGAKIYVSPIGNIYEPVTGGMVNGYYTGVARITRRDSPGYATPWWGQNDTMEIEVKNGNFVDGSKVTIIKKNGSVYTGYWKVTSGNAGRFDYRS